MPTEYRDFEVIEEKPDSKEVTKVLLPGDLKGQSKTMDNSMVQSKDLKEAGILERKKLSSKQHLRQFKDSFATSFEKKNKKIHLNLGEIKVKQELGFMSHRTRNQHPYHNKI